MGYIGHKMSERAVEAYRNGEKPLSKWTKEEILKCIESKELEKMRVAFKKFFNLKTTHRFNKWISIGGQK